MTNPRDQALDFLSRLGSNPATAFQESGVAATVKAILAEIGLTFQQDTFGNIIAKVSGTDPTANPLAIVAHMDHPRFETTGSNAPLIGTSRLPQLSAVAVVRLRPGSWSLALEDGYRLHRGG